MPDTYTQTERPIRVTTALGPDKLLLTGFAGTEGLSQLYRFTLDLKAPAGEQVDFAKVLGKPAAIELDLPEGETRHFHGIVSRFAQGRRDEEFITYRAELVPTAWLLTRREQSRIFQHMSVPDILKKVLTGIDADYQIKGTFEPRDYCVQYRESDWAFASRLMEEEGIFYFFTHTADAAKLVLANTPQGHPEVPGPTELVYDEVGGGGREEGRVWGWEKVQEVVSGKFTLWDHCFELPGQNLEAAATIPDTVAVGTVDHALIAGQAASLEVYEYPGGAAGRFDGVDAGGGDQPAEVGKIFGDARRTAGIRLQESAAAGLRVNGVSDCGQLTSGHKFALTRHFDADGEYVLTRVDHEAIFDSYQSTGAPMRYSNRFECLPAALPFRPPRVTPRPIVRGSQTATVVGPAGEEIFTDKYGRIKVQFHWDRQGKFDADSSCWIRVGTLSAGKGFGGINIPRIGQEVIVNFLEGDADQPIVVGSVYNADQMPPWGLPGAKTQSGLFSNSSPGGGGANAIRLEDSAGNEQIWIHAQKNQDIQVKNDETHWIGRDRKKTVDNNETTHIKNDRTETVGNNETITINGVRKEAVAKDETIDVTGSRTRTVGGAESVTVSKTQALTVKLAQTTTVGLAHTVTVGAAQTISVGLAQATTVGAAHSLTVIGGQTISIGRSVTETVGGGFTQTITKAFTQTVNQDHTTTVQGGRSATVNKDDSLKVAKKLVIDAGEEILIKTGSAELLMKKDGSITLKGKDLAIEGSGKIGVKASSDLTLKGSKIGEN
ncbi:MAG TPA: type VI secretion system tip protein TssI/VgrG [Gemmataceae bacterium]|nr:type VI secretion system tip protein TssI/VgrG [Gemmataceae bacterium]